MKLFRAQKHLLTASRRISLTGLLLIALTIIAAAVAIWERREAAIAHYREEMSKLGVVLAEQTARSVQAIDLVLQEVQAKSSAAEIDSPEQFNRFMGTEAIRKFFVERQQSLPQAVGIGVVGSDGTMLNVARPGVAAGFDVSDRDYFTYFRDHDDRGLFISEAMLGRVSRAWTFFVARRVSGFHGQFVGVVVVLADIRYFEDFYRAITTDGESVSLFRRDGIVLARHPHVETLIGSRLSSASPWYKIVEGGGGTYRTPGYLGGIPRIIAARPIREYPLAITIGVSEEAALAGWRKEAALIALTASLGILGYLALFAALAMRTRKLEEQSAELARSTEAVSNSEARFRDFALTSSDWFWETDQNHRFTYISDGIRRFGQNPDLRLGKTRLENATDRQSEPEKWEQHLAALQRREPFRDFIYTRKAGSERAQIISISGKPFFDAAGQFLGYRGTGSDVTEQIRAGRRLEEAKMAAEAANIAKSQFLANMSHELRTPLNAIIGFSDMLTSGLAGRLSERQHEYTEIIQKSGTHLLGVINDVLDLAKIDAGKFTLQEEAIDPSRLIADCLAIVSETAHAGSVRLSAERDAAPVMVVADTRRLKQVVLNLLSNAIKFTKAGGSVTVGYRCAEDGGLLLQVRDTGLGMTAAEIAVALQPFGQVDGGLERRHEGTGLGLPLARSLVELHGGSLQIDSEKGTGTTVTVALPASRMLETPLMPPAELTATAA